MPQLDLMTYFPQFLWFAIGFCLFYLIFLFKVIPTIGFNLKFRKKKLGLINNSLHDKESNFGKIFVDYYFILSEILQLSRNYTTNLNTNSILNYSILMNISNDVFHKSHRYFVKKLVSVYLQIEIKIDKNKLLP